MFVQCCLHYHSTVFDRSFRAFWAMTFFVGHYFVITIILAIYYYALNSTIKLIYLFISFRVAKHYYTVKNIKINLIHKANAKYGHQVLKQNYYFYYTNIELKDLLFYKISGMFNFLVNTLMLIYFRFNILLWPIF